MSRPVFQPVRRRGHAARVALVAAVVVATGYVLCALALGAFVNHRLLGEADSRLRSALSHVVPSGGLRPVPRDGGDHDTDNQPIFVWRVGPSGVARPLTADAPRLDRRHWTTAPVTLTVATTPFRFDAVPDGTSYLVAGQSVATIGRVDDALVLPALALGLLLAAATFAGAFVVGLRASAPLELVRRRQAEFTADASHELRTPLSVVEAEVELALRQARSPEEYQAVLERIGTEGRRLRRIVEDLLWLARADAGDPGLEHAPRANVTAIAKDCVERFQALAEQRGALLRFEQRGDASAVVQAAPEWVDRLAGVLVDNACKYAGQGGSATVTVDASLARVVLQVDDSGPGIPPEERSAVFDRFHRATTEAGGAGLGLAIADSVVRMSGASWTVGASPLGGARLAVSWRRAGLPVHARGPGARGPGVAPPVNRPAHAQAGGRPG